MGCGTSSSFSKQACSKNEKRAKVVQQLFTELQDDDSDAVYRGEVLVSLKYIRENELVVMNLLKGYSLLSRDGQFHSCNPYIKFELKYNESKADVVDCSSSVSTAASPTVEHKSTLSRTKGRKLTRSTSLQHYYHPFRHEQVINANTCTVDHNISNLDLAQVQGLDLQKHLDKVKDDPSHKHNLSFKHEISTVTQSKVAWHTQNPEYNELFLFNIEQERLSSAYLFVSVMDKEIIGKDTCIGHVTIPLGSLSITGVQNIPSQWFTVRKPKNEKSQSQQEVGQAKQQGVIRNQEFREAMLAHNSLQGLVMVKGTKDPRKTKVYRLTSVKHQKHARIVM